MKYEIILENEEDGRFSAHVPSLPGCHSWGRPAKKRLQTLGKPSKGI